MHKIRYILYLFLLGSLSYLSAQNGNLKIIVSNIQDMQGKIYLSIYNAEDHFLEEGYEYKVIVMDVNGPEVMYELPDLNDGEYAIGLYQDTNGDGKCNRTWIGIPTEPYGFSQNYKPRLRAPSFDETKFDHNAGEIKINLIHK